VLAYRDRRLVEGAVGAEVDVDAVHATVRSPSSRRDVVSAPA
jgi:hypothetical protein